MIKRKVTESDFRLPEFREANPDDYEFRDDGKIVRKDRWKTGMTNISSVIFGARYEFEIPEVIDEVKRREQLWCICSDFISEQNITCYEKIYSSDVIASKSFDLIESICNLIGYDNQEVEK